MAGQVIVVEDRQPWRLRYLRHVLAHCQLHDYDSGRWSRFVVEPGGIEPPSASHRRTVLHA
jgi:hypothetical protein